MKERKKFLESVFRDKYLSHVLYILLLIFLCSINSTLFAQPVSCPIQPFGSIIVAPDFELDGPGKNIDTMDFWEAPDPANTMLFVTAKDNSLLEVWKYPFQGKGETPLRHPTFSNSNVNGIIIDRGISVTDGTCFRSFNVARIAR